MTGKSSLILLGVCLIFSACAQIPFEKKQRIPAAMSSESESPAIEIVDLVCAGSAMEENTFSFSNESSELKIHSDPKGKLIIYGRARVRVRSTAERSDFDGPLAVQGDVSFPFGNDQRRYRLKAQLGSGEIYFDLVEQGDGQMIVHFAGQPQRIFKASCLKNGNYGISEQREFSPAGRK